jgi:hypothetical protein
VILANLIKSYCGFTSASVSFKSPFSKKLLGSTSPASISFLYPSLCPVPPDSPSPERRGDKGKQTVFNSRIFYVSTAFSGLLWLEKNWKKRIF